MNYEKQLSNTVQFYQNAIVDGVELPHTYYSTENGTMMVSWYWDKEDQEGTRGLIEIGITRWVAYYEWGKEEGQVNFGQGTTDNITTEWLPRR